MSKPFKPKSYASYRERAQALEEQGWWLDAKEAWSKAVRVARRQDNWFEATSRRDYCQRKIEQIREQELSR